MNNRYSRSVDESIYIVEAQKRYESPKESFKQALAILEPYIKQSGSDSVKLLDVGCATGEFLHFMRKANESIGLRGIEYSRGLVESCRSFLAAMNILVEEGDANNIYFPNDSFDVVTTFGVTSIFDDFRPSFSEMIRVAKPGSVVINQMLVNEMDVDVIVKYINPINGELESGWNKFSISSIKSYLKNIQKVKDVSFIKHVMPFDIPMSKDLMRSYTREVEGKRILWNGLNMEISLYFIVIEL